MPITEVELKEANAAMLGNTNRGILFTTVNLSKDAPRLSNYLSDLAAGLYTWEQFNNIVKQKFIVKTFPEFLDKFQPCFYYRLSPPREPVSVEIADAEPGAADNVEEVDATADTDETQETDVAEAEVELGDAPEANRRGTHSRQRSARIRVFAFGWPGGTGLEARRDHRRPSAFQELGDEPQRAGHDQQDHRRCQRG